MIEKKNKEQEEKRRKEAEERTQKHSEDKANNDRLQKMADIVKMKVQNKPMSKVQCIEPLPLPPSAVKKGRRVSDDRRSSTDSEGTTSKEKNADKSLEKVSPLGTLYGEMPQPAKTSVFRIPKKPRPKSPLRSKKSPTPPKSKKTPSPAPSSSSSSEEDTEDTPALRYDSSEEEVEKPAEQQVAKPDSTEPPTSTSSVKGLDSSSIPKEVLAEAIRSTLLSMGIGPGEKKTEEEKPEEPPPANDITNIIRSLVQEEIQKIQQHKNEPEVSSSSAVEVEKVEKTPDAEPAPTDVPCAPDQSNTDPPKEKVEQMFSESEGSDEDTATVSAQTELRNHLKKAVRIAVRKNELDKLHEDIDKSFIKDGVIGAVGPRTRNPIARFTAEPKKKVKKAVIEQPVVEEKPLEEKPLEEKTEEQDANLIDVTRQPVIKLTRLPSAKKRQMAKRGRAIG